MQELYKNFKKFTILLIFGLSYCLILNRNAKAMDKNYEIDNVDLKILGLLMQDATMP